MYVTQKTAKQIGFWTAISILIGSVVGIGIFFKNGAVFGFNGANGYGVLISWILAAVIAVTTAFSFGEISSSVKSKAGLAEWATKLGGTKIGYFIKLTLPLFYFAILLPSIFIFVSEGLFSIFDVSTIRTFDPESTNPLASLISNTHVGYVFLVGIAFFAFTVFVNIKWGNATKRAQVVLTASKFIPLLLTIIVGFIFFSINGNNLFVPENIPTPPETPGQPVVDPTRLNFTGILAALPSILFAFDSFLSVGSLGKEMKNGEKKIPFVIIVGMIVVASVYLLITISQILMGANVAPALFATAFGDNMSAALFFEIFIDVFLFLSVYGVGNSLVISSLRNFDYLAQEKIIYKHYVFKKAGRGVELAPGAILLGIFCGFWMLVMMIPSVILNTDVFVDALSNFPTLFFFVIYGLLIVLGLMNRKTQKVKVHKIKFFIPIGITALIGIALAFGYQIFFENLARLIMEPNAPLSFGVFFSGARPGINGSVFGSALIWHGAILFFTALIAFIIIPFANKKLCQMDAKHGHEYSDGSFVETNDDEELNLSTQANLTEEKVVSGSN